MATTTQNINNQCCSACHMRFGPMESFKGPGAKEAVTLHKVDTAAPHCLRAQETIPGRAAAVDMYRRPVNRPVVVSPAFAR